MGGSLLDVRSSYALRVGRYVPDSSAQRALAFFLLFVYHGAHALGKTYAMALLVQVNWLWLVVYTIVDHATLQMYMVARADFWHWLPGAGVVISLLTRFNAKVLADFTGTCCLSGSRSNSASRTGLMRRAGALAPSV
jgi:hypothetical protein